MRTVHRKRLAHLLVTLLGVGTTTAQEHHPTPEMDRTPKTFDARVAEFWSWFRGDAAQMHARMHEPWMVERASLIGKRVHAVVPRLSWTFGPADAEGQHEFVLSPEGDPHHAILARRWIAAAPRLEGWVFRAGKRPQILEGLVFKLGSQTFDAADVRIASTAKATDELIDVFVHHPAFAEMPEQQQYRLAFLFLDAALGEAGTEQWVGAVEVRVKAPDGAIPLVEFPAHVKQTIRVNDWPPDEDLPRFNMYERVATDGPVRTDVFLGSTRIVPIIEAFHEAHESGAIVADPFRGIGARYAYLAFAVETLESGKETRQRYAIEEALAGKLEAARVFGGAFGHRNAYIDLVVFDESKARAELRAFFATREEISAVSLHGFAMDGQGVVTIKPAGIRK